jgi:hypothetical protein
MSNSPETPDPRPSTSTNYNPVVSARLNALFSDTGGPPSPQLSHLNDRELLESSLISLNELFRRAKAGNNESADFIFRLAMRTTLSLHDLIDNPLPSLLNIAHSVSIWPSFYSPKANFLEPYNEALRRLEVGKRTQLNTDPKSRWGWHGEARKWAAKIHFFVINFKTIVKAHETDFPGQPIPQIDEIAKAALELPPLTKDTAKEWMQKVGWPYVLKETGNQPEKHPELRKLGMHRQSHTVTSKLGSKTSESNIRDGIKKRISQALLEMASQSSTIKRSGALAAIC